MAEPNAIYTAQPIAFSQNNYDPDPDTAIFALTWRVSAAVGLLEVTGLAGHSYQGVEVQTRMLFWANVGLFPFTLKHESGLSSASNRFLFAGGLDKVLGVGETILLVYDSANQRWRQATL